jgi:hypothetical protein
MIGISIHITKNEIPIAMVATSKAKKNPIRKVLIINPITLEKILLKAVSNISFIRLPF